MNNEDYKSEQRGCTSDRHDINSDVISLGNIVYKGLLLGNIPLS